MKYSTEIPMNPLSYYVRQKEQWNDTELQQIRTEYEEKHLTISQLGDIHQRTPGQISYALKRINLITDNKQARGYPEYHASELYKEIVSTPKVSSKKVTSDNPDEILEHQGEKWSELEEQQLLNEIEIGMDDKAIAKNHSRTYTAIRKRIRHVIYELHRNGISTTELVERMKLPEEEIVSIIQCYVRNHENRQQRNEKKIQNEPVVRPLQIAPPLQSEFNLVKTVLSDVKTELSDVKTELSELKTEMKTIKTEVVSLMKMMKHLTRLVESMYEFETEA